MIGLNFIDKNSIELIIELFIIYLTNIGIELLYAGAAILHLFYTIIHYYFSGFQSYQFLSLGIIKGKYHF